MNQPPQSRENTDCSNHGPSGSLSPAQLDSFRTPPKDAARSCTLETNHSEHEKDFCQEYDQGWLGLYAAPKTTLSSFSAEDCLGSGSVHNAPVQLTVTTPRSMGPLVASSPEFDGPHTGRWGPVGGKTPAKIKVDSPLSSMSTATPCRPVDVMTMSCLERQCSHSSDLDGCVYEVRFKRTCRYFLRSKREALTTGRLQVGNYVHVEADRGHDVGLLVSVTSLADFVALSATTTAGEGRIRHNEKRLMRLSTQDEAIRLKEKALQEASAVQYIQNLCKQRDLPLKIIDTEFQYDNAKLTVYYEATTYVVFQQLVREIYKVYKTRIWLEQVGGPSRESRDGSFSAAQPPRSSLSSDAPVFTQLPGLLVPPLSSSEPLHRIPIVTPERAEEPGISATAMAAAMAAQTSTNSMMEPKDDCSSPSSAENPAPLSSPVTASSQAISFSSTFICPITQDIMLDPVICSDGYTYDRTAIVAWLKHSRLSPKTQSHLASTELKPNDSLRSNIQKFRDNRLQERLERLSIARE
jgi:hypothetical protein